MITEAQLVTEAMRFLRENYDMELRIPIVINSDFITEEGAFEHTVSDRRALAIHIGEFMLSFAEDDVILDTLRHELVHYALFEKGLPFFDGDEYFENELKRLGVASTKSGMVGRYFVYECEGCGEDVVTPRYMRKVSGVVTVCCEAGARYTGRQQVYNGKERIY